MVSLPVHRLLVLAPPMMDRGPAMSGPAMDAVGRAMMLSVMKLTVMVTLGGLRRRH
ncbi:MAG: hypothetical protein ACLP1W_07935 [Rhodomicrobium sp.]